MPHRTKLALILIVETLLFAVASLVHAGVLTSGFAHRHAMIAEGVIGAVLGLGLLALLIWPTRGLIIALAAQGFALRAGGMAHGFREAGFHSFRLPDAAPDS